MALNTPHPVSAQDAVLHRYVFVSDGEPAAGDHNGVAPTGALLINKAAAPGLYINVGTLESTDWAEIFQEAAS